MKKSRMVNILVLMLAMMMLLSACQTTTPAATTKAPTSAGTTAAGTTAAGTTAAPTTAGPKPVLELTAMLIQYATPPDQSSDLWKTIEKKFNIHYKNIEWVSDAAYTEKLNITLSSDRKSVV